MISKAAMAFLFFTFSSITFAEVGTINGDLFNTYTSPSNKGGIKSFDFEKIDYHTGQISMEVNDVSIPGNGGMDLNITRSYQKESLKNYRIPHLLGNWSLGIPKIEMNSGDEFTKQSGCTSYQPGQIGVVKLAEYQGKDAYNYPFEKCDVRFGGSVFRPDIIANNSVSCKRQDGIKSPYSYKHCYDKNQACNNNIVTGRFGLPGNIVEPDYIDRPWLGVNVSLPGQDIFNLKKPGSTNTLGDVSWVADNNSKADCINVKSGFGIVANVLDGRNYLSSAGFRLNTQDGLEYDFNVGPSAVLSNVSDFGSQRTKIWSNIGTNNERNIPYWNNQKPFALDSFKNFVNKLQYYPSEIRDRNGNYIRFEYENLLKNDTSAKHYGLFVPKRIYTNDGREVTFTYYPAKKIWSSKHSIPLLRYIKVNNKTWQYIYNAKNELQKVILPDGASQWFYTYNSINPEYEFEKLGENGKGSATNKPTLQKVTTPLGSTYNYTYENRKLFVLGGDYREADRFIVGATAVNNINFNERIASLKTRSITGSGITNPSSQTFDYEVNKNVAGAYVNKTQLTDSNKRTEFSYKREPYWGLLISKKIFEENGGTPVLLENNSYTWKKDSGKSRYQFYIDNDIYRQRAPKLYAQEATVRLATQTTSRKSGNFKTTYSDFDGYLFPKKVVEQSSAGTTVKHSKTTDLTYAHNTTKWLLGLPNTTKVDGILQEDLDYDTKGNVSKQTVFGIPTTYTHHAAGDIKTVTDADGRKTEYLTYKRGVAQTTVNQYRNPIFNVAETYTARKEVDYFGNITSETNRKNKKTSYVYDKLDRVTKITYPLNLATDIRWPSPRQSIETRGGYRLTTNYDALGRVKSEISNNKRTDFEYDELGRLSYKSDPCAGISSVCPRNGITHEYDALGRIKKLTHTADNSITSYNYDDTNHAVSITTPSGTTKMTYKRFANPDGGYLKTVNAPENVNVAIDTDVFGKTKTVTIGSLIREYKYDTKQRLIREIEPERTKDVTYTYYNTDKVKTVTVPNKTITYHYDTDGQVIHTDPPGTVDDIKIRYNKIGQINRLDKGTSVFWDYSYDANGNRLSANQSITSANIGFGYVFEYNTTDSLNAMKYPSGKWINYNPDVYGRPTTLGAYLRSITYHPDDSLKSATYKNGLVQTYRQDTKSRLDEISIKKGASNRLRQGYRYDLSDNRIRTIDELIREAPGNTNRSKGVEKYAYDGLNRLNRMFTLVDGKTREDYTYDNFGNIINKKIDNSYFKIGDNVSSPPHKYNYDPQLNWLKNITNTANNSLVTSFEYREAGHLKSKTNHATGKTTTYYYDPYKNLTSASTGESFTYDGNHRLTVALADGNTIFSSYLGENKQVEYNVNKNTLLERYYLNGKPFVDELYPNVFINNGEFISPLLGN